NDDGRSRLTVLDTLGRLELAPAGLPEGRIGNLRFDRTGRRLAMSAESPVAPRDAYVYDIEHGRLERWTRSEAGPIDAGTFLALDNGPLREDAVRDVGSLLVWIGLQPQLDRDRVVTMGASYGGYMALATLITYGERLRGGIDFMGISNFVSFLRNTSGYRRDLRRTEYGDERDNSTRVFLDRISPLTNAGRIRKPLLVAAGANDPRVP